MELRGRPLTLLFGTEVESTLTSSAGVEEVEVGVVRVTDATTPISQTIPTTWTAIPAGSEHPDVFRWSHDLTTASIGTAGLYRVYTRACDAANNCEVCTATDYSQCYEGAIEVTTADSEGGAAASPDLTSEAARGGSSMTEPTSSPAPHRGDAPHASDVRDALPFLPDADVRSVVAGAAPMEDTSPPVLTILSPQQGGFTTRTIHFVATATDDSGVAGVAFSVDGGYIWRAAEPVTVGGEQHWVLDWDLVDAEDFIRYPAMARAMDSVGGRTLVTVPVTLDSWPPSAIEPTFDPPAGHYVDDGTALSMAWSPPVDASGQADVLVKLDEVAEPDVGAPFTGDPVVGAEHTAVLNDAGKWYVHLTARDRAGNESRRDDGPWSVRTAQNRMIDVDGYLDLDHGEWVSATELLDDDERPEVPQRLYASWDASSLYLGWQGAWWPVDGALWVYLGENEGRTLPVPDTVEEVTAVPVMATRAIRVSSPTDITLWTYDGMTWTESSDLPEFATGSTGDTEMKIGWPGGPLTLVAFAVDNLGRPWSVFHAQPARRTMERRLSVGQSELSARSQWRPAAGQIDHDDRGQPAGRQRVLGAKRQPALRHHHRQS